MMCISLFSYGRPVVVRCKGVRFGWVWVGLGHGSISSPGSGLGWVGSVIWWVGLGWVDENRPTDNSAPHTYPLLGFLGCNCNCGT